MSLYIEASQILSALSTRSLKSLIYSNKSLKSPRARLYALVVETLKHQVVLNEVIERSGILGVEKKLTQTLTLPLLHDFLLTKPGIATSPGPLKSSIHRHKSRLTSEFTRIRLRMGFSTTSAYLASAAATSSSGRRMPRWVRVNTLKSSIEEVLKNEAFVGFKEVLNIGDLFEEEGKDAGGGGVFYKDPHIPNLLGFSPSVELVALELYKNGTLVLQDKASCFPAFLLSPFPSQDQGDIIDATAAPGNKTTHLAAILGSKGKGRILAFERDRKRAVVLKDMVKKAGAQRTVEIFSGVDFLETKPEEKRLRGVRYLLLDPSCSGSGIVGREEWRLVPLKNSSVEGVAAGGKKRKRPQSQPPPPPLLQDNEEGQEEEEQEGRTPIDKPRLASLAAFQKSMILHAMSFPSAKRISYSTCSIHAEENEQVVVAALCSEIAKHRRWRVEKRAESKLAAWERRGIVEECAGDTEVAEACVRCEPVVDGGIGFFVVVFVRDRDIEAGGEVERRVEKEQQVEEKDQVMEVEEEEWKGFEDEVENNNIAGQVPRRKEKKQRKLR